MSRIMGVWRIAALAVFGAALVLAGGCRSGASVTVDISVPPPLVEPMPVRMGVYFDGSLQSYVHEEELEEHGAYSIDIGASQVPVFDQVFRAMFDSVVPVERAAQQEGGAPSDQPDDGRTDEDQPPAETGFRIAAPGAAVDAILAPSIDEVQFAIPDQTGGEFFEVWIRYRIRLFDAAGAPIGEWPLIGYGKANRRNYRSMDHRELGLNEATIWALRDAAAVLSFQFGQQTEVRKWLATVGDAP